MKNSHVIIHYLCHNWRRHLAYACLSVRSLMDNGLVSPRNIMVSVSHCLKNTPECDTLRFMGVRLRFVTNGYVQKLIAIEDVFREEAPVEHVIQLDADTVLVEGVDFVRTILELAGDRDFAAYKGDKDGERQYRNRFSLFLPAFRPDHPEGKQRLGALTHGLLGLHYPTFEESITTWILGGLTVWRRTIRQSHAWGAMQALAWVCRCDEVVLQMIRDTNGRAGASFHYLDRDKFPHRVCPERFTLTEGPGMVHYAGDWYREHNAANRAMIAAQLRARFDLELPEDAPVGPKKAGDPDPTKKGRPGMDPMRALGGSPRPGKPLGGTE